MEKQDGKGKSPNGDDKIQEFTIKVSQPEKTEENKQQQVKENDEGGLRERMRNDDNDEKVLKRVPKLKSEMQLRNSIAYTHALNVLKIEQSQVRLKAFQN
jgi:hypothetical protein